MDSAHRRVLPQLPLRADAPLATDWLNGRRSTRSPTVRNSPGTLTGLDLSTSAPEIYYAFAEATAFATKHILDHMRDERRARSTG